MNTREMRIDILKMALAAKSQGAHMGGSLSMVEVMAALYGGVMKIDPQDMENENRDRLIISKGHGVMAQYVALRQLGLISADELLTYKGNDSLISAHPAVHPEIGIEYASGSLGMGLSLGVGAALALRRKKNENSRMFVILGDGECDEGSVWEAAASASHYHLNNVVVVVDRNGLQYDGSTEEVMALENFEDRWKAFGWDAVTVDGHDVTALTQVLNRRGDKPLAVIARTVKGRGVSFMENDPKWHNGVLSQKMYEQALAEVEGA